MTPTPEELQRLRARLAVALADEAPVGPILPFALLKTGGALVALLAAAAVTWQLSQRPPPPPPPAASAPVASSAPVACPAPQCPALQCPAPPPAPRCPPVRSAAPPTLQAPSRSASDADDASAEKGERVELFTMPQADTDRWALEVGLLTDARVALDEGRMLDALGHLARHEQLFASSPLEEERVALEVLSYCALARPELAGPRLSRLRELAPESTYLPRIAARCGALDGGSDAVR
ncbi:MAG: hypothetical protein ACOZQL_02905 [Myxococcota bacterium]